MLDGVTIQKRYEEWCADFDEQLKTHHVPMTQEESISFLQVALAEKQDVGIISPELESNFIIQVIKKRAEHIGLSMTQSVLLLLALFSHSPGMAVMLISYMKWKLQQMKRDILNIEAFSLMFPFGLLSPAKLEEMWDKQKLRGDERSQPFGSDNLLDRV